MSKSEVILKSLQNYFKRLISHRYIIVIFDSTNIIILSWVRKVRSLLDFVCYVTSVIDLIESSYLFFLKQRNKLYESPQILIIYNLQSNKINNNNISLLFHSSNFSSNLTRIFSRTMICMYYAIFIIDINVIFLKLYIYL